MGANCTTDNHWHHCAPDSTACSPACASKEQHDDWMVNELHSAMVAQDTANIMQLLMASPQLKERELCFGPQLGIFPTTALGFAIGRRDVTVVQALLAGGASPNSRISKAHRNEFEKRAQAAAISGDRCTPNMVPHTEFEALCSSSCKELFMLCLAHGGNPSSIIVQVCYLGDLEMLGALLDRSADPNSSLRESTPLISSVKSSIASYNKALVLLRAGADPNRMGSASDVSTALFFATQLRDYRLVRILLEAGADVNAPAKDIGLPNALFWATYWGEFELIKLFVTLSKIPLDLRTEKYTAETVFDVATTAANFARLPTKPRHITKLSLPNRPAVVYDKILEMLHAYRVEHPDVASPDSARGVYAPPTASTAVPSEDVTFSSNRLRAAHGVSEDDQPIVE